MERQPHPPHNDDENNPEVPLNNEEQPRWQLMNVMEYQGGTLSAGIAYRRTGISTVHPRVQLSVQMDMRLSVSLLPEEGNNVGVGSAEVSPQNQEEIPNVEPEFVHEEDDQDYEAGAEAYEPEPQGYEEDAQGYPHEDDPQPQAYEPKPRRHDSDIHLIDSTSSESDGQQLEEPYEPEQIPIMYPMYNQPTEQMPTTDDNIMASLQEQAYQMQYDIPPLQRMEAMQPSYGRPTLQRRQSRRDFPYEHPTSALYGSTAAQHLGQMPDPRQMAQMYQFLSQQPTHTEQIPDPRQMTPRHHYLSAHPLQISSEDQLSQVQLVPSVDEVTQMRGQQRIPPSHTVSSVNHMHEAQQASHQNEQRPRRCVLRPVRRFLGPGPQNSPRRRSQNMPYPPPVPTGHRFFGPPRGPLMRPGVEIPHAHAMQYMALAQQNPRFPRGPEPHMDHEEYFIPYDRLGPQPGPSNANNRRPRQYQ